MFSNFVRNHISMSAWYWSPALIFLGLYNIRKICKQMLQSNWPMPITVDTLKAFSLPYFIFNFPCSMCRQGCWIVLDIFYFTGVFFNIYRFYYKANHHTGSIICRILWIIISKSDYTLINIWLVEFLVSIQPLAFRYKKSVCVLIRVICLEEDAQVCPAFVDSSTNVISRCFWQENIIIQR